MILIGFRRTQMYKEKQNESSLWFSFPRNWISVVPKHNRVTGKQIKVSLSFSLFLSLSLTQTHSHIMHTCFFLICHLSFKTLYDKGHIDICHRCLWTRLSICTPTFLIVIILWSDDHTLSLQNNKPRCVLISIYQTKTSRKYTVFTKKWLQCTHNTGRLASLSLKSLPLVGKSFRKY